MEGKFSKKNPFNPKTWRGRTSRPVSIAEAGPAEEASPASAPVPHHIAAAPAANRARRPVYDGRPAPPPPEELSPVPVDDEDDFGSGVQTPRAGVRHARPTGIRLTQPPRGHAILPTAVGDDDEGDTAPIPVSEANDDHGLPNPHVPESATVQAEVPFRSRQAPWAVTNASQRLNEAIAAQPDYDQRTVLAVASRPTPSQTTGIAPTLDYSFKMRHRNFAFEASPPAFEQSLRSGPWGLARRPSSPVAREVDPASVNEESPPVPPKDPPRSRIRRGGHGARPGDSDLPPRSSQYNHSDQINQVPEPISGQGGEPSVYHTAKTTQSTDLPRVLSDTADSPNTYLSVVSLAEEAGLMPLRRRLVGTLLYPPIQTPGAPMAPAPPGPPAPTTPPRSTCPTFASGQAELAKLRRLQRELEELETEVHRVCATQESLDSEGPSFDAKKVAVFAEIDDLLAREAGYAVLKQGDS